MVGLVALLLSAGAIMLLGGIYAHLKMIYSQLRLYEDYYEKRIAELNVKLTSAEWDADFNYKCLESAESALRYKEEVIEGLKEKFYEEYGEVPEEEEKDTGWNEPYAF